jgi:hypothetical protein
LEQEVTVGIQSGNVIFSFKTDRTGSNVKEAIKVIKEIIASHGSLFENLELGHGTETRHRKPTQPLTSEIVLSSLNIPSDVTERIVNNIREISRLKLVMILLHYSKGLTYKSIMALSRELGKPIIYGWLNTDFQRKEHREFIKSESISGSQEKLYSLTEPGKKKTIAIIEELRKKTENPPKPRPSAI